MLEIAATIERIDRCLSPRQVARYLRLRLARVLAMIHTGELVAANTARPGAKPRYVVPPESLAAWLKARSVQPEPVQRRRQAARPAGYVERY